MTTEDLRNEITALHATEQNLRAVNAELLEALKEIVNTLSDQDEEGLIEHAVPMIAARAAIAKASQMDPA